MKLGRDGQENGDPQLVRDGFSTAQKDAKMIRIDSVWLATEQMDMFAGTDTALAGQSPRRGAPASGLSVG